MSLSMFLEVQTAADGNGLASDLANGRNLDATLEKVSSDQSAVVLLRADLLNEARRGPVRYANDLDVSLDLVKLASTNLERFGTDGSNSLDDEEIELVLKTLKSVLRRMGIPVDFPFRNFSGFHDYWLMNGGKGSWQARRSMLRKIFDPLRDSLDVLEENRISRPLVSLPISDIGGWDDVDIEIRELRRKYEAAVTAQDYRALGTNCIGVLEAVGKIVYDPSLDLLKHETDLPYDRIKERLDRYTQRRLLGDGNKELRAAIRSSVALVNRLKHRSSPDHLMAAIAADSTLMIANSIRRLADPSFANLDQGEVPF